MILYNKMKRMKKFYHKTKLVYNKHRKKKKFCKIKSINYKF